MNLKDINSAIASRLKIAELNPMQKATAAIAPPCRLMLLAPTGSGKTVAFALPLLRALPAPGSGKVCGLVLAPSRELVLQIYDVVRRIATGYKTVAFYGGHPMADEVKSASPSPDIIVATPGRLLDHLRRGSVDLSATGALVLDEYDKALDLGFDDEMRRIVARMKNVTTLILTSATPLAEMPAYLDTRGLRSLDFTGSEAKAPAPKLDIALVESPSRDKLDTLADLLTTLPDGRVMVFVNHRESADRIVADMRRRGFSAGLYHGGLEQQQRERALVMFANGTTPVLVTTDLAARGLDIPAVGAVVHYHMPVDAEAWTHRNGRTGRQGADGRVFVISSEADNIPDFVRWDHPYAPAANGHAASPAPGKWQTLYINAGKKEKISRGDIAGYLIHKGGLEAAQVGMIDVRDHCAYVAVPRELAREVVKALQPHRLKNTRVRVSRVDD